MNSVTSRHIGTRCRRYCAAAADLREYLRACCEKTQETVITLASKGPRLNWRSKGKQVPCPRPFVLRISGHRRLRAFGEFSRADFHKNFHLK